jgi:hypothetical protein
MGFVVQHGNISANMSLLGQSLQIHGVSATSALAPKADI